MKVSRTEFGLPPSIMKGAFGSEGALLFLIRIAREDFPIRFLLD
jgi:hypothetical protein